MSTKSSTIYTTFVESRTDWTPNSGIVITPYRVTLPSVRSRDGQSNPFWKKTIASGQNASTAFSASEQLLKVEPLKAWYNQTRYGKPNAYGSVNGIMHVVGATGRPTAHPTSYGNALDKANASAVRALYNKMRSVRSQFSGGIELGTLAMTVRQMVRPAESLRKLVLSHSKKMQSIVKKISSNDDYAMFVAQQNARWRGPKRYLRTMEKPTLLKALADTHLEAVYGWSPLISDLRDAAVVAARLVKDSTPQRFRVWGSADQTNGHTADSTTAVIPFQLLADITGRTTVTVVYYGAFSESAMATMAGPPLSRIQELSGFGLRDFVPTVWDLIPWSFVVDYFANVGDVLSAACTDTSVVARLTKVTIVETSQHEVWKVTPNWYSGNFDDPKVYKDTVGGSAGVIDKVYRSVSRAQTGVPSLEPRIDLLGPSTRQWLNLGALYVGGRSQRDGYRRGLSFLHG